MHKLFVIALCTVAALMVLRCGGGSDTAKQKADSVIKEYLINPPGDLRFGMGKDQADQLLGVTSLCGQKKRPKISYLCDTCTFAGPARLNIGQLQLVGGYLIFGKGYGLVGVSLFLDNNLRSDFSMPVGELESILEKRYGPPSDTSGNYYAILNLKWRKNDGSQIRLMSNFQQQQVMMLFYQSPIAEELNDRQKAYEDSIPADL